MVGPPPEDLASLRAQLLMEQRKLAAVRELGRALGPHLDLHRILRTIVFKVPKLLDAERATLYVLEPRPEPPGAELVSRVVMGGAGGDGAAPVIEEIRLRPGVGIAGSVAQSGQPLNIPDAYADPRFNPDVDRRTGFHTRSILCVPIPNHEGLTCGVLQALNRKGGVPFDADDEALLGAVAAYVGVALENSQLYQSLLAQNAELLRTQQDLKQRIAELDLLFQIERESSAAMDPGELVERLGRRAVELLAGEAGLLALRLPRGELDVTCFRAGTATATFEVVRGCVRQGDGPLSRVVRSRRPALAAGPVAGLPEDLIGLPVRGAVVVPLDSGEASHVEGDEEGDEALGAIAVFNARSGAAFTEADLKLLTLLGGHAARAIVLSRTRLLRTREGHLASIGRMLASLMHDLRTPMTIVSGYAQLMAGSDDPAERERYVQMIGKQFQLMESMTGEVMAFARGDKSVLVRRVLLNRFADELREQLSREVPPDIKLELEPRYLGPAYFDELKMLRLVHNLARNAVQAMPGGGTLRIVIDAREEGGRPELVFTFSDTGGGLPDEVQAHLFEAFVSHKDGGTGLGLAIVKKIVDDHHGRIRVSTHRGEGTTFTVAIPLSRE